MWPADERYAACAPAFFGLLLDLRLAAGEVWVADGGDSVAMWNPPGGLYLTTPGERPGPRCERGFSAVERDRWATYDDTLRVPGRSAPHWYLGVLATRRARQGTGLGRAVLAPILAAADRTHLATYLETASDANLRFYGQLGFGRFGRPRCPTGRCAGCFAAIPGEAS